MAGEPRSGAAVPDLVVRRVVRVASGVNVYELARCNGLPLPSFEPGAHIDLHLPNASRSYSIVSDPADLSAYSIAVALNPASRGGSRWIHDSLSTGTVISASQPRNLFALNEDATASVFIAGGIGITPIWTMIRRLEELGRPWTLHYAIRSRGAGAFVSDLAELAARSRVGRVNLYVKDETPALPLLIADVVGQGSGAHVYCCGPDRMLKEFEAIAASVLEPAQVHLERFGTVADVAGHDSFSVRLAKSRIDVHVSAESTILQAVCEAGVQAPSSCEQGVCGECETRVLEGIPDHQDLILSDAERAANTVMMICCSRARTDRLVLDL